ncbi:MAG: hypothetical protein J3Q66DRAFT_397670 [Benniella sp.]|nr:MAG: hypothetical protein J3Q66DRAFT_397670 [Benniella sp.]
MSTCEIRTSSSTRNDQSTPGYLRANAEDISGDTIRQVLPLHTLPDTSMVEAKIVAIWEQVLFLLSRRGLHLLSSESPCKTTKYQSSALGLEPDMEISSKAKRLDLQDKKGPIVWDELYKRTSAVIVMTDYRAKKTTRKSTGAIQAYNRAQQQRIQTMYRFFQDISNKWGGAQEAFFKVDSLRDDGCRIVFNEVV